jgi:hypothetical protein
VDAGINKGFDRTLKFFAHEAPALLLRVLGFAPAGSAVRVKPLRTETSPSVVLPDYVAAVRIEGTAPTIFHAEFQSNYDDDVPSSMARYGGSLAWQYKLPVASALVMMRPDRTPKDIPEIGCYRIGLTETFHPYKVVRLWEIDPGPVLETNNVKLLPWALVMKTTFAQANEIGTLVGKCGDEDAVASFLMLGGVRYDRGLLAEMLGGAKMGLVKAILDGSIVVQQERDRAAAQGLAKGLAQGQAEGTVEEGRKFLRLMLRKRFPALELLPEIDAISDITTLESLGELVMDATEAAPVQAAIVAAAQVN